MDEEDQGQFDIVPVGEQLRLAREAKGMSLDDVATRTRIPIRHLQNIEAEEWDAMPAATYAVGFTRNYANAVGLDGATIANELRERIGGPRRRAAPADIYEPADPARVPPRALTIVAAIMLVLIVGGYLIWRSTLTDDAASIPVLVVPAETGPAATPAPQAAAPQVVPGQAVTLTATGDVWLRVSDGPDGVTLFMGSLAAGQTFSIPSTAANPVIRTGRPQLLRAAAGTTDLGPLAPDEHVVDALSLRPQDIVARARAAPPPTSAPPLSPVPAAPPAQ